MADPRVRKHLQQGIALHQSGRFVEADGHYRKVLALQPNNPDALHMLGVLALQQGAFDKALGCSSAHATAILGCPSFTITWG